MTAVLGWQWGDEGKGKLVDVFSAGHTIVVPVRPEGVLKTFAFHLLPSGVYMNLYYKTDVGLTYFVSIHVYRPCIGLLNPACVGLIGSGVVVHLPSLFIELDALAAQGMFLFTLIPVTLSN